MPSPTFLLERSVVLMFQLPVSETEVTVGKKMQQLGCEIYQCDLTSQNSINAFVEKFKSRRLDILLNIAGD